MTGLIAAPLLAILAPAPAPPTLQITPPAVVVDIDAGQVHGTPIELAWAPDSGSWYLETIEGTGPTAKHHSFLIAVGDKAPRSVNAAPDWAATYWQFKSNRAAPAHPQTMIQVDSTKQADAIPVQSLSQKAAGASNGGVALQGQVDRAIDSANAAIVQRLTVDGTTISQLVDEPLIPGLTFGWAPEKYDAIAFRNEHHHGLSLYRLGGTPVEVNDTKEILLPAWSPDGTRVVFLERIGKKKYEMAQVKVALP